MDYPSKLTAPIDNPLWRVKPTDESFLAQYLLTGRLDTAEQEKALFLTSPYHPSRELLFSDGSSSRALLQRFQEYARLAVFEPGAAREDDFKRNQGQGAWAENLLLNTKWPGYKLVPFGPSDGVIPKEEDYEKRRLLYREILVLEGKRPDLLLFPEALSQEDLIQLSEWPNRALLGRDRSLMEKCICGIEIKSSLKHYERWREKTNRPLSITVKKEELDDIEFWIAKFSQPILFVQSFIDELYICSFAGMKGRMERKDCTIRFEPRTGKKTYMFPIISSEPLLARIQTDFSFFKIDEKGNVKRPTSWSLAEIELQEVDILSLLQTDEA